MEIGNILAVNFRVRAFFLSLHASKLLLSRSSEDLWLSWDAIWRQLRPAELTLVCVARAMVQSRFHGTRPCSSRGCPDDVTTAVVFPSRNNGCAAKPITVV
jgi:hypothetical protein